MSCHGGASGGALAACDDSDGSDGEEDLFAVDGKGRGAESEGLLAGGRGDGEGVAEDAALAGRARFGKDPSLNLRLLDRALEDSLGCARYQHRVLLLAMLSFFVAVSSEAMTNLLMVEFKREWGVSTEELALVHSLAATGKVLGSFSMGFISDQLGRTGTYVGLIVLNVSLSVASSFSPGLTEFSLCHLGTGFAAGGIMVLINSILSESVPSSLRAQYVVLSSLSISVSSLSMNLLAWALFPSIGWRWVLRGVAVLGVLPLLLSRYVTESLRFLVVRGEHDRAVAAMQRIAENNEAPYPWYFSKEALATNHLSPAEQAGLAERRARERKGQGLGAAPPSRLRRLLTRLSSSRNLRILAPLLATWFQLSFAGNVFHFLPLEMKKFLGGHNAHFVTALVMGLAGLTGAVLTLLMVRVFSRVYVIRVACLACAVATYSLFLGNTATLLFTSIFAMHTVSSIAGTTLYVYTPEMIPTKIRATALGLCVSVHELAHVAGPWLSAKLASSGLALTGLVYGSLYLLCWLFTFALVRKEGIELYEGEPVPEQGQEQEQGPGRGQEQGRGQQREQAPAEPHAKGQSYYGAPPVLSDDHPGAPQSKPPPPLVVAWVAINAQTPRPAQPVEAPTTAAPAAPEPPKSFSSFEI
jgi:putative MFS transporter